MQQVAMGKVRRATGGKPASPEASKQRGEPEHVEATCHGDARQAYTEADKSVVRTLVQRDWRGSLAMDEYHLVSWLFEATIERGKEIIDLTWGQISAGVEAVENSVSRWRLPPLRMSRAAFYKAVTRLRDRGLLITRAIHKTCTYFSLNLGWAPEGSMPPRLAMPKRMKNTPNEAQNSGFGEEHGSPIETQEDVLGSLLETPNIYTHNKRNHLRASRSVGRAPVRREEAETGEEPTTRLPAPHTNAREAIAAVQAKGSSRREEASTKRRSKDDSAAYHRTFATAWDEAFPDVAHPTWTQKEGYMVRASLRARFPDIKDRHDFLDFCVRDWKVILATKFGWMKEAPPPMPKLSFLFSAKLIGTFMDAYAERSRIRATKLVGGEEAQVRTLTGKGLSREEALIKVGERRALSKRPETNAPAPATHTFAERERGKIVEERKQMLRERVGQSAPQRRRFEGLADELPPMKAKPE